jgi:hypothetical protein
MRDLQLTFMNGAIGTTAATTYTDVIDIGQQAFPIDGMRLYGQITTTVTSAGAATVLFALEKDTTAAFASATEVLTTAAIAKATLVAGYTFWDQDISSLSYAEAAGSDTYLRVKKTIGTADLTAGDAIIYIGSAGEPIKNKS